jgi:hypothetical protein
LTSLQFVCHRSQPLTHSKAGVSGRDKSYQAQCAPGPLATNEGTMRFTTAGVRFVETQVFGRTARFLLNG